MNVKVSIVIPCFDEGRCIEQTIDSCLASSYSEIEIIVVDYGSTEPATIDLLNRLNKPKTRVIYERNCGLPAARNAGIKAAQGDFIVSLDADDLLHHSFLEKAIRLLEQNPMAGIASPGYHTFGAVHYSWEPPVFHFGRLLAENIICISALFRKQAWLEAGGYNEGMTDGYEDWDFWISLSKKGWTSVAVNDAPLAYRVLSADSDGSMYDLLRKQVVNNHPELFHENRLDKLWLSWLCDEWEVRRMLRRRLGQDLELAPIVSIVIPCYNYGQYVEEAVDSCLNSTFQEIEIIVVNNGSTDPYTIEVLQRLQRPKTRVIHVQTNIGLPYGRNVGIREARGKYILPLDADDKIQPTLIEKAYRILEARPEVGFATVGLEYFGDQSWVWIPPEFDFNRLLSENIVCVTSLVRKSAWLSVGGYNEAMIHGYEDWDFWISLCERGWRGTAIHEALLLYRRHGHSLSYDAGQKHAMIVQQIRANHPRLY
ncbi:glycosyltransferase family 2 protein [Paenibacillus sp. 2TAB26]|uniref:glycosyltransferase family 2 protein n=1 Tax=Paenibacillus sp. 2TAB26 TaxID=3233005 RepID=UPI003F95A833